MADWNPALYLRFADERTRPAAELLARVPLSSAARVIDLGCGPGNSTELLARRFPSASVLGLDHSPAMIEQARARVPGAAFQQQDMVAWAHELPNEIAPDLIYSNAALQWVGDHARLFPRLLARLAPGGVLAVQMPDNLEEPTHRLMREVARLPRFAAHLANADQARARILSVGEYHDLLTQAGAVAVDLWRTTYHHVMASAEAIVEWLSATGLRPFLSALPEALRADFLDEYGRRIAVAYPERVDGCRLMAFPRLFLVARRTA